MPRRLLADVSWLWAGYVGRSLAFLGVTVLLTRSLGPHGFGELSLFMAFGLGVASLAGSWPFLAVPILAQRGRRIAEIFRPAIRLAALGTLACLIVALPLAWAILAPSAAMLLMLCIYAIALVSFQGLYGVFQAEGRMREIATVQTGERVLTLLVLAAIALAATLSVRAAEGTLALAAVVASGLAYLTLVKREDLLGSDSEAGLDWRTVLKTIGAMGIVNAASYGVAWIDIYLLAAFKPASDVGIYSLAYQIYTFALQLASLWIVATLPRHARSLYAGVSVADQLPREKMLMGTRVWAASIGIGTVVTAIALSSVFGSGFSDSAQPLMILLVGASFLAPYLAVVSVLIAADESPLIARVSIACVAINIGIDLVLIPTVGLLGPAVATTAQSAVGAVWLISHALGGRRLIEVVRASVPAAAAIALLAIDPTNPALLALTAIVSLVTAAPALRWLRESAASILAARGETPLQP
jgi:O-antigen/teichoic acid export membrane protein